MPFESLPAEFDEDATPGIATDWADADLNGPLAGMELASGGKDSTVRVTQVFVSVNVGTSSVSYTYADGPTGMNTLASLVKNGVTTSFTYDAKGTSIRRRAAGTTTGTPRT